MDGIDLLANAASAGYKNRAERSDRKPEGKSNQTLVTRGSTSVKTEPSSASLIAAGGAPSATLAQVEALGLPATRQSILGGDEDNSPLRSLLLRESSSAQTLRRQQHALSVGLAGSTDLNYLTASRMTAASAHERQFLSHLETTATLQRMQQAEDEKRRLNLLLQSQQLYPPGGGRTDNLSALAAAQMETREELARAMARQELLGQLENRERLVQRELLAQELERQQVLAQEADRQELLVRAALAQHRGGFLTGNGYEAGGLNLGNDLAARLIAGNSLPAGLIPQVASLSSSGLSSLLPSEQVQLAALQANQPAALARPNPLNQVSNSTLALRGSTNQASRGNAELLDSSAQSSMNKKRQREPSSVDDSHRAEHADSRFEAHLSPFHEQAWKDHFLELIEFRKKRGHCNVPQHSHIENPKLARWVKRQRYQYKLRREGRPSNITRERIKALEQIGFVWDSHNTVWEERFRELKDFHRIHGHVKVPTTYQANRKLAAWVKCQRRQYKLLKEGKSSNMTDERREKLEKLGFEWQLRAYHNTKEKHHKSTDLSVGEDDDDEE